MSRLTGAEPPRRPTDRNMDPIDISHLWTQYQRWSERIYWILVYMQELVEYGFRPPTQNTRSNEIDKQLFYSCCRRCRGLLLQQYGVPLGQVIHSTGVPQTQPSALAPTPATASSRSCCEAQQPWHCGARGIAGRGAGAGGHRGFLTYAIRRGAAAGPRAPRGRRHGRPTTAAGVAYCRRPANQCYSGSIGVWALSDLSHVEISDL